MKFSRLALASLAAPLAAGFVVPAPGVAAPGTNPNCSKWVVYRKGLTCQQVVASYGVSQTDFQSWNPIIVQVHASCVLVAGYDYCVGVNSQSMAPSQTASPPVPMTMSQSNSVATPTPYQASMTPNCNSFHMVVQGDTCESIGQAAGIPQDLLHKMNPSLRRDCSGLCQGEYVCIGFTDGSYLLGAQPPVPSSNAVATPTLAPVRQQSGMMANCRSMHMVAPGETCESIAHAAGIPQEMLLRLNPFLGNDCSSLNHGRNVCINAGGSAYSHEGGFQPQATVAAANGIATPTPYQAGMTSRCNRFHLVQQGDTCYDISAQSQITLENFYSWNPAVGSTCAYLWLGYYVCTWVY